MKLTVTKGGPLPFAYDILTTVFDYGNRAFVKYPTDIVDYFNKTFPEGFSWERAIRRWHLHRHKRHIVSEM